MAKAQSEIIVFVLLLLITLILVFTAVGWGSGIGQKNINVGNLAAAENWIKTLDSKIQSVVKSGGSAYLDYGLSGKIGLADVGLNDTIEIIIPADVDLPVDWINLTTSGEVGLIREHKDGTNIKLQLSYPLQEGFAIDLFTDGPQIATPKKVVIERNETYTQNIGSVEYTVASIRLRFV